MNGSTSPMKRATRTDVAKLANVSTAVVSYVFNNGPRKVAPETAERVRDAAEKLNYRPNSLAKALKTGTARILGVIVADLSNPYYASVIDAIETNASEQGYATVIMSSHGEAEIERERITELSLRNVDATLVFTVQNDAELISSVNLQNHVVFLDHPREMPGYKCVSTDFMLAGEIATKHLISHGYRDISILFGGTLESNPRLQGWMNALQKADLPIGTILKSNFTRESGYEATQKSLQTGKLPEAIFAGSDLEAIGAMYAIHENGLRIPEDIALISVDGTVDSQYTYPQLSVVQQDAQQVAKAAIDAALLPSQETPAVQLIPAQLIPRASCGHNSRTSEEQIKNRGGHADHSSESRSSCPRRDSNPGHAD